MEYRLLEKYRNRDWMAQRHYRYDTKFSRESSNVFRKTFSVWKQGDTITLEARILLELDTGKVTVDVLDTSFHGRYAPYYLRPSYYSNMLKVIDDRIKDELNKDKIFNKGGTV